MSDWKLENRFFRFETPWVTFYGEHLRDDERKRLEYYRVEKADSIIVIPEQKFRRDYSENADDSVMRSEEQILLYTPKDQYRPGFGRATLDFPGGRVDEKAGLLASAARILERELGLSAVSSPSPAAHEAASPDSDEVASADSAEAASPDSGEATVELLSPRGYPLNSSFSDQKLYFALARIRPDVRIPEEYVGKTWFVDQEGINSLLEELECVQCRLALLEYLRLRGAKRVGVVL